MLQYLSLEEIVDHPGLRIVLVRGVPSPWSQAAKTIFEINQSGAVVKTLHHLDPGRTAVRLDDGARIALR